MPLTSGRAVFATGADTVETKIAADALTALGLTATAAEVNYTDGVTSAIQTQLDARPTTSSTSTLTNKRITARVVTEASTATVTPNADTTDEHTITAQAEALAFAAPSGTPTEGQPMIIRIKDNGTARALSYNGIYRAIGVTLPTTTVLSKTMYIGMIFNSTDTKWDVLSVCQEA